MDKICQFNNYKLVLPTDVACSIVALCLNGINPGDSRAKFYSSLLKPNSTVLDIGANIGTITMPLATLGHNIIAIEALPYNCDILKKNIEINNLKNIDVLNIIANDSNGNLYIADYGACSFVTSNINEKLPDILGGVPAPKELISVKSMRLDDVLNQKFDLVKIDIEGSELAAFKGMDSILQSTPLVLFECNEFTLKNFGKTTSEELCSFIKSYNYDIYLVDENDSSIRHCSSLFKGQIKVIVDYLAVKKGFTIQNNIIFPEHDKEALIKEIIIASNHNSEHHRGHIANLLANSSEEIFQDKRVKNVLINLHSDSSKYVQNMLSQK